MFDAEAVMERVTGTEGTEVLFSTIRGRVDSAPDRLLWAVGFELDVGVVMFEAERTVCWKKLLE